MAAAVSRCWSWVLASPVLFAWDADERLIPPVISRLPAPVQLQRSPTKPLTGLRTGRRVVWTGPSGSPAGCAGGLGTAAMNRLPPGCGRRRFNVLENRRLTRSAQSRMLSQDTATPFARSPRRENGSGGSGQRTFPVQPSRSRPAATANPVNPGKVVQLDTVKLNGVPTRKAS